MADTYRGGRDGGHGGRGGRRSGRNHGGSNGELNVVKRKSRRNGAAREQNELGGDNVPPHELNGEEEITLPDGPVIPLLANERIWNGEGHGVFEGGPNNGWSYAGQNEPIPGYRVPDNAWSYGGQNNPIPGAQQPGNNRPAPGGQLVGLDEFPCYSPVDTWAGDASRGNNPMTDLFFDFGPNGGHPAPNA
ncbi:hypothetical protein V493_05104 [Pseudogymnoascus sp. VKM F-4281 (FW-2241)]|nr:hypothetical protein V493_05104 [Pseudogymnoascus sp. VKM F-4281 (FW-2241)]